ncbi:hypothetical protein ACP70R_029298 [Stipagrostis hirtigluma subsp. patula]
MAGRLVMATRGEGVEGFPSLLREMMWRANFTYPPEFVVYGRGVGAYLSEFSATVDIPARLVHGSQPYHFSATGTSVGMAIQEVALTAMAALRSELYELEGWPFTHFPQRGTRIGVNVFAPLTGEEDFCERA